MKVEIQLIKENNETPAEIIELFNRLGDSFFPFLIIRENKREVLPDNYTYEEYIGCVNSNLKSPIAGWTGTLQEFVRLVELRESFGKDPDKGKMYKAFGLSLSKIQDEISARSKKRHDKAEVA